jgi:hypothetical protein
LASAYPSALDTLSTSKADATVAATDHAAHHNDMADAINKIEAELGTLPKGTFATVKARLDGALYQDMVTAAATRIIANELVGTDTQPAFRILGSGKMEWGVGGTTVPDVNLYRSAVGVLACDQAFATGSLIIAQAAAAADTRIGAVGPASAAGIAMGVSQDVVLYRSAADILTLATGDVLNLLAGFISLSSSLTNALKYQATAAVPQASATQIFSFGTGYVCALVLACSQRSTNSATRSVALLLVESGGTSGGSVTKISEIIRPAGGADTFTVTAFGNTAKFLSVATSGTGSPGNTDWKCIALYTFTT